MIADTDAFSKRSYDSTHLYNFPDPVTTTHEPRVRGRPVHLARPNRPRKNAGPKSDTGRQKAYHHVFRLRPPFRNASEYSAVRGTVGLGSRNFLKQTPRKSSSDFRGAVYIVIRVFTIRPPIVCNRSIPPLRTDRTIPSGRTGIPSPLFSTLCGYRHRKTRR